MNQFTFTGREKMVLLGFMVLGLVCLIATYFSEPAEMHHMRFWSNFLHNVVFFTGISFVSLFAYAAFTTSFAGWFVGMKRIWEAYSLFLIVGLIGFIIIIAGLWGHLHHLYHWAADGVTDPNDSHYDKILAGKASFLNKYWYTFGTIIFVGIWYVIARKLRSLSIQEDQLEAGDFSLHWKTRNWAALFLPIGAFSSAALIWLWIMSLDAHWYSTMYAWYTTASWFVSALALTILMLIYLKSRGYYPNINANHFHDIGKYTFGFSVFWTYLWFSQFMLIWYANVGEETIYFLTRREQYPVLFYGNLIMNFALPFLILLRNDTKRKFGSMGFVAALVLFGHWWDFFQMIKPGALINAMTEPVAAKASNVAGYMLPGLLEIGIFLGFLAGFIYFVFGRLAEADLVPKKDPYYGESMTHHVV